MKKMQSRELTTHYRIQKNGSGRQGRVENNPLEQEKEEFLKLRRW